MSILNKTKRINKGGWNTSYYINPQVKNNDGTTRSVFNERPTEAEDYEIWKMQQMGVMPKAVNMDEYNIGQRMELADKFEEELTQVNNKLKTKKS